MTTYTRTSIASNPATRAVMAEAGWKALPAAPVNCAGAEETVEPDELAGELPAVEDPAEAPAAPAEEPLEPSPGAAPAAAAEALPAGTALVPTAAPVAAGVTEDEGAAIAGV